MTFRRMKNDVVSLLIFTIVLLPALPILTRPRTFAFSHPLPLHDKSRYHRHPTAAN